MIVSIDREAGAVTWRCLACGNEYTTTARAIPVVDGTGQLHDPKCGATAHVPYNDWSDEALLPDVQAEMANAIYRLRGDAPVEDPLVRLVELPEDLGGGLVLEGEHPALPDDAVFEARQETRERKRQVEEFERQRR